jgi:hypothetical protein
MQKKDKEKSELSIKLCLWAKTWGPQQLEEENDTLLEWHAFPLEHIPCLGEHREGKEGSNFPLATY